MTGSVTYTVQLNHRDCRLCEDRIIDAIATLKKGSGRRIATSIRRGRLDHFATVSRQPAPPPPAKGFPWVG